MKLTAKSRFALAWLLAVGVCGIVEVQRLQTAMESDAGILGWLFDWNRDTTLPWLVLAALPLLVLVSRSSRPPQSKSAAPLSWQKRLAGGLLVAAVSLTCSLLVGWQPVETPYSNGPRVMVLADLPPAYHDEYSYLLQARTFAAGQLSWPAAPIRPDLFHQMHVLNETRTASRYFPWTGLWMAPFVSAGQPFQGHWLAGALAAMFFYLSATEFLRPRPALLAGLLIGVSPGLAMFSNMLLAHHPTLLALSIFLWTMLRLLQHPSATLVLICGTCLTLAMLGRPMTAAGFALPWGLLFGWLLLRSPDPAWQQRRLVLLLAMGLPIAAGFGVLAIFNHELTGSWTRSGYQEYTDIYTPRHVYGFNNGIRGDAKQTPKVLTDYDQWAENLTWPVALKNVRQRGLASSQWTLGTIPLLFGLSVVLLWIVIPDASAPPGINTLRLIAASVISLHVVHVPYWYDGIMHWHYVFETAPLLLLLMAGGLSLIWRPLTSVISRRLAWGWMALLLLSGLVPGWVSAESLWGLSSVAAETCNLEWSRRQFERFRRRTTSASLRRPALVLVDESASNTQLSYVINDPQYQSEVLVARLPATTDELHELQAAFADRTLYRFDPQSFSFHLLTVSE